VLVGAMLKRSLGKDEPLLARDVIRPTEHGFLAAVVGQGMIAVTIGTDVISGTAGLISPGDRVDVILSQVLEEPGLAIGRRVVAETVLTNARVVAIDQQIIQGEGARASDGAHGHTVTLEATSDQAQRLTVAARIGRLSLTVRSADINLAAGNLSTGPVFASDVSRALAGQVAKHVTGVLHVYPGSGESREFRF
jgi:pilus assembly protein CpaB